MKSVLILFGGNSYEHEISCKSVNFIINNIDENLFNYKLVGINFDNEWYEVKNKIKIDKNWMNNNIEKINNIKEYVKNFDIVFPIIHGNTGEDGKIQALLELFGMKYVGCNSHTSLICYDKLLTKLILEKYSIPQIPYHIYNKQMSVNSLDFPVIIKPAKCGSSIGIGIAYNKKEFKKKINNALKYDSCVIIEKFIENKKELECAILEDNKKLTISDIGEIINQNSWYDFKSKYENPNKTIISDIENSIKDEIKCYSKKIFNILQCKDLSRLDFIYDLDNNKLYFNEINTLPGMTDISMFPRLIKNSGISYKDLITILLGC